MYGGLGGVVTILRPSRIVQLKIDGGIIALCCSHLVFNKTAIQFHSMELGFMLFIKHLYIAWSCIVGVLVACRQMFFGKQRSA